MSTDQPSQPEGTTPGSGTGAGISGGPGMLSLGAILVLGVYVLFELLLGEYFQSWIVLVAAVFVLVLPRVDRTSTEKIAPLAVILKALGYVLAAAGLLEALNEIRFGRLDEAMEIVGALIAYGGYVLSFLGARSIEP